MRLKKVRNARRRLAFYRATYGIKAPFRVLVDGTALQTSINLNINLKDEVCTVKLKGLMIVTTADRADAHCFLTYAAAAEDAGRARANARAQGCRQGAGGAWQRL